MNYSIIEGCIRQSLDLPIKKKIAILDLDGTLWNFHSGYTTFKTVDQLRELIYPEVFDCLKLLADRSIPIAIASASPRKDYCMKYFDMAFSEFKHKFKFIHVECCSKKKHFKLTIPTWRPDISQEIDVVEELVRITGYDKIKTIDPIKERNKSTLTQSQKLFHFLQRAIASKGYLEAITWSFTDSNYNNHFRDQNDEIKIVNPISSELGVLRNSIFSNLIMYMNKNLDRGFKDLSIFEIGPIFTGSNPGEQNTVVCGLSAGKRSRLSWIEKERNVDVFDVKRDVVQTLIEAGYNSDKFFIDDETPNYYHPGKSGRLFLNRGKDQIAAYFGEIHPNIIKNIDIKTESLVGFEIFLDNLKLPKKTLKDQKTKFEVSDYQKSERDFAFVVDKEVKAQDLINAISSVDQKLISNINVFDVYEGENIPENQKSIAISVTIQSSEKTLNDSDLENINNSIIKTVENKTGAKIRS